MDAWEGWYYSSWFWFIAWIWNPMYICYWAYQMNADGSGYYYNSCGGSVTW